MRRWMAGREVVVPEFAGGAVLDGCGWLSSGKE